jgi:hypothetical protein
LRTPLKERFGCDKDMGDLMQNSFMYHSLPNAIFVVLKPNPFLVVSHPTNSLPKVPKGQLYSLWSWVLEFFPKPLNKRNYSTTLVLISVHPEKVWLAILKGALKMQTHFHTNLSAQLGFGLLFVTHLPNFRGPLIFLCTDIDTNGVLICHF